MSASFAPSLFSEAKFSEAKFVQKLQLNLATHSIHHSHDSNAGACLAPSPRSRPRASPAAPRLRAPPATPRLPALNSRHATIDVSSHSHTRLHDADQA